MFRLVLAFVFFLSAVPVMSNPAARAVSFDDLPGWQNDDHAAAFTTFLNSCKLARSSQVAGKKEWRSICAYAQTNPDPKNFFELFFQPIVIEESERTLFTGYYEPEIKGSLRKGGKYQTPIYRLPKEVTPGSKWKTRAEIQQGVLDGRGLELAWLEDPVEAFFLQIQGSGRVKLPNGKGLRVGYAGFNGHKYRSIGLELVRRNLMTKHEVSAQRIKAWVKKNPKEGRALLAHNPSYVFFREVETLGDADGPIGAMTISVTAGRTVAVDPKFTPLGAPVYIDKRGQDPMQRLMIAQDVGSAIKGPQRADIFYGTGAEAGRIAGRTKASGRMYVLLPIEAAQKLLPEG